MVRNRWFIIIGILLIQICLGALHAWSVFRKPLQEKNLTPTQATLPYAFAVSISALTTIIGGRWQDKKGPKIVSLTGGILFGLGLILSGVIKSFLGILLSYGILSAIGLGLSYVSAISVGAKWFPDMRGLITGISVAGLASGTFIIAQISRVLIDNINIFNTFIVLGISFLILITIGSLILKNPPEGYVVEIPTSLSKSPINSYDYSPSEIFKTYQFYLIWFIYFLGCATGLMIIGQASPIGQELAGLTKEKAAFAVGILAIFNALGRVFWGKVSDLIGRMKTLFFIFLICGIAVILYIIIPSFPSYYWIGIPLVGLCFGGYLGVFPAVIADFYGIKNVGMNYGLVFNGCGIGGLIGNIFMPQILEKTKSYDLAFITAGILCLLGAITTFLIKHPKKINII
ncbi:MAG: OFA family MFS transporter [candidate division WOR-3 bacterium]|nr:OFA family MFS transporter [candidate division WOR-3 bacterium]